MNIWTIFADPADFPGQYVARRFLITAGDIAPTADLYAAEDYHAVLSWLMDSAAQHGNAAPHRFPRVAGDDSCVVESWL